MIWYLNIIVNSLLLILSVFLGQSTEKQLKECKMLIKLLESENTQLKLELESRSFTIVVIFKLEIGCF